MQADLRTALTPDQYGDPPLHHAVRGEGGDGSEGVVSGHYHAAAKIADDGGSLPLYTAARCCGGEKGAAVMSAVLEASTRRRP